jgi:hypothetical protein
VAAVIAGHRGLDEALGFAGGPDEGEPREGDVRGTNGQGRRGILRRGPRSDGWRLGRTHVPRDRLSHEQPDLVFIHRYASMST